jgi:hypothetical protein
MDGSGSAARRKPRSETRLLQFINGRGSATGGYKADTKDWPTIADIQKQFPPKPGRDPRGGAGKTNTLGIRVNRSIEGGTSKREKRGKPPPPKIGPTSVRVSRRICKRIYAQLAFRRVTDALTRALGVDVSKQLLDSTQIIIISSMSAAGKSASRNTAAPLYAYHLFIIDLTKADFSCIFQHVAGSMRCK